MAAIGAPISPRPGSGGAATPAVGAPAAVNFSTLLPAPDPGQRDFYLDANYADALPCGAPVPSFPFLDQNDTTTVEFRQKWEQALVSYKPPVLTQPMPGRPGLYPFGDVNWQDGGAGVACFERTFGNIPPSRTVRGQSFRYPYQYILVTGAQITGDADNLSYTGPSYSIGTFMVTVDCTVVYDYFLDGSQAQFPLVQAPSMEQIGNVIAVRGASYKGTTPVFKLRSGWIVSSDALILAQNDTYVDYKGAVKARKRMLIPGPTTTTLVGNLSNLGT